MVIHVALVQLISPLLKLLIFIPIFKYWVVHVDEYFLKSFCTKKESVQNESILCLLFAEISKVNQSVYCKCILFSDVSEYICTCVSALQSVYNICALYWRKFIITDCAFLLLTWFLLIFSMIWMIQNEEWFLFAVPLTGQRCIFFTVHVYVLKLTFSCVKYGKTSCSVSCL